MVSYSDIREFLQVSALLLVCSLHFLYYLSRLWSLPSLVLNFGTSLSVLVALVVGGGWGIIGVDRSKIHLRFGKKLPVFGSSKTSSANNGSYRLYSSALLLLCFTLSAQNSIQLASFRPTQPRTLSQCIGTNDNQHFQLLPWTFPMLLLLLDKFNFIIMMSPCFPSSPHYI